MAGEVSEDNVMFIVARTLAPTFEHFIKVVEQYHTYGNSYSRNSERYELSNYKLEDVTDLATRLWNNGRIHQPRIFVEAGDGRYRHPVEYGDGVWMEVSPGNKNTTPAVIEAYEKFKMLDSLTK